MKKKKAVKAPLPTIKFKLNPWLIVLITALLLQSIGLMVTASYIGALRASIDRMNEDAFKSLVSSSVHGVYSEAVLDPVQERVYLPELRVYVPLNATTRHMVYSYLPGYQGSQDYTIVSVRQVAQRRITDINSLSCNRMARVLFAPDQQSSDEDPAISKPLKDGRTIYIFKSRNACDNLYTESELNAVVNSLVAAESY